MAADAAPPTTASRWSRLHRIGVELVFSGAEYDSVDRAGKVTIVERHLHGMIAVLILVHQHDGPLTFGTLDGVSGHQNVAVLVLHIAADLVELVNGINRLHPFFGDYLRCQILRRIESDPIIFVDRQEAAAPTSAAAACRDVMEMVSSCG